MPRSTTTCPPPAQSCHDTGDIAPFPWACVPLPPLRTSTYATCFMPFAFMASSHSLGGFEPDVRSFDDFLPFGDVALEVRLQLRRRAADDSAAFGGEALLRVGRLQ